ncbi:hypothetical protein FBU59_001714, partial [Linderina macrospora]
MQPTHHAQRRRPGRIIDSHRRLTSHRQHHAVTSTGHPPGAIIGLKHTRRPPRSHHWLSMAAQRQTRCSIKTVARPHITAVTQLFTLHARCSRQQTA